MSATFAPNASAWPAPSAPHRNAGWHFGCEQLAPRCWQFDLRRQGVISSRQLVLAYVLLCGLSLLVATGFWWQGVVAVGVVAGLELLGLGLALGLVARHAGDFELVTFVDREMKVEQRFGQGVVRTTFRADRVRVEPTAAIGSLVELSGEGHSVRVGRHVRPELRDALAQELRRALRLVRATGNQVVDHEHKA